MNTTPGNKYKLEDLIDIKHFQDLQDRLNEIYSFPSAIIDNDGNILTASGWQDICFNFHRKNKESQKVCIQSDKYITEHLHEANPGVSYLCPNGLVDNATPIIIDGVHYGNFFTGQSFWEEPDPDFFKAQAKKYGFPEDAYLEAVKKVPIRTKEQFNNYLLFIKELITIISESGLKNLKQAEARKQIKKSEEQHRTILQTAIDGFLIIDKYGDLVDVNDAYCEMSGYTREELLNMNAGKLESVEPSEEMSEKIDEIVEKKIHRFIRRHKRKDGSLFDVEISSRYQPDQERFVCFVRDITEKIEMESQLRQVQKMESIGTLAGGIAHDFNNILSPIMMHAEMAMEDLPSDDPLQHSMREIFNSGARARDLVKQILTFARKGFEKKIPIKVSLIIKEVLNFIRSTIPSTINIRYENKSNSDTVLADATQLNQIIMNLCTNAAHAMKQKGGLLEIILDNEDVSIDKADRFLSLKPGRYFILSVKDDGTGIPPDILNRIFEPYYTTKKVGEGTGLGLATVHGIVQNYGGDITVESTVGQGTIFRVYLPLIEAEIQRGAGNRIEIPKGKERILLVDDEKAAVDITHKMLERFGYNVTSTTSSLKAFDIFRESPSVFDLIITDMTMPNMAGDALAKEIMAIKPEIPVILCTGYSDKIDEEKAKEIGIRSYVMKPIVMSDLAKTIREVLDKVE